MILIDERKLTNGTLSAIGQDYKIPGLNLFKLEEYSDKVLSMLLKEEREYYRKNNYPLEIEYIIDILIQDGRREEIIEVLKDLQEYANGYKNRKINIDNLEK